MVHALEEIWRLLKPAGTLIDIHPVAEPSAISMLQNGKVRAVGDLSVRQWCFEYEQADQALAESVQRGLFMVEHEGMFESLTHLASAAELRSILVEDLDKYARDGWSVEPEVGQIEALAAQAEQMMAAAGGGAELTMRERAHISRLRPIR